MSRWDESNQTVMTFQQHIFLEQKKYAPRATGEFSFLLSGITLATKMIQTRIRHAGLTDILGTYGAANVHGEEQQKLDIYANHALLNCLGQRGCAAYLVSEENDDPVTLQPDIAPEVHYAIIFDPLDGSSNIDVNVSVGTIFSIVRVEKGAEASEVSKVVAQPGVRQVAAGYVLYGTSTVLVYTTGYGVHMFTLEPNVGAFILTKEHLKMPEKGMYYSVNEAYADHFPEPYPQYIQELRKQNYSSRYIGSLVADFHRTLLRGGVFFYPPTKKSPTGKLRLLYEANPMAFLAEQAGGQASDGTTRIMDIVPNGLHHRVPLIVGGKTEMELYTKLRK